MRHHNLTVKIIQWIISIQVFCVLLVLSSESACAQTVYVTSGNGISAVDSSQRSVLATIPTSATFLTTSQDGSRLYASAFNGLDVIDVATNIIVTTIPVGANPFESCLSPDGKRLYVAHFDSSSVFVIDVSNNSIISTISVPGNPVRIAISPDASRIYVSTRSNGVAVVNPATNSVIHQIAGMSSTLPTGISFLPDSSRAYIGEAGGPIFYVVDARNDALIQAVTIAGADGGISGITVTPNGNRIYLTNVRSSSTQGPRAVLAVDSSTNTVAATIPVGGATTQIAVSSDGSKVFVGDSDIGNLDIIDVASNSITASVHVSDLNLITGVATKPPVLTTTVVSQLFYGDTVASQRIITQLAVDNTGNVISFTLQTAAGCGFGICGAVIYSIAPDGLPNWISSETNFVGHTVNEFAISPNNNILFQDTFSLGEIRGLSASGVPLPNWPVFLGSALDTFSPSLLIDPVDQSVLVKGGAASAFLPPSTRTASFQQDGTIKWTADFPAGADNTPGMLIGPNNNLYTFSDHTVLVDRNDGHKICEFPFAGGDSFVPITGGDGLAFSYTNFGVQRSDSGCLAFPIYNWETNRRGQLLDYDQGVVFAFDLPLNNIPGTPRFIAITKDGALLWHNDLINAESIVAIKQGLVYVVGIDTVAGSDQKLFVVNENDGSIAKSIDLIAICPACVKVAVGSSGVYVGDASSTRIFKINGIGPVSVGTIQVITNNSAATFTITGPATYTGKGMSFTQPNAPAGVYTIQYQPVAGYSTPPNETKTLTSGATLLFSATYSLIRTPKLTVSPGTLAFSAIDGFLGHIPVQSVSINTDIGFPVDVSISLSTTSGGQWLSVGGSSGTTPIILAVRVSMLPIGKYSGNIRITSSSVSNNPIDVPVTFTVTPLVPYTVLPTVYPTGVTPEAESTIARARSQLAAAITDLSTGRFLTQLATSSDSGNSWMHSLISSGTADNLDWSNVADPVIAMGRDGAIYVAEVHLSGSANGLYVAAGSSTDPPIRRDQIHRVTANTSSFASTCEDKPWITVDNSGSSFDGTIYAVWDHLFVRSHAGCENGNLLRKLLSPLFWGPPDQSRIMISVSHDRGISWSQPKSIGGGPGTSVFGPQVAVAPNGSVYVVYQIGASGTNVGYAITLSTDGGNSFADSFIATPSIIPPNFSFIDHRLSSPAMAISPLTGEIAIAFADQAADGTTRIKVVTSTDGGQSFGDPVTVNDTQVGNRFRPVLTYDDFGILHIAWIDTRKATDNRSFDIYASYAADGGTQFAPNTRLTLTTITSSVGDFIGDYNGGAAVQGSAWFSWAAGSVDRSKNTGNGKLAVGQAIVPGINQ